MNEFAQTKRFSVSSNSTNWNTSTRGSVFIWGDNGIAERVRIVESIEIDPNDWGGVVFYIPQKWYIANIISSYPENSTESAPSGFVSTAITGKDESREWRTWIEVGRDRSDSPQEGGEREAIKRRLFFYKQENSRIWSKFI